MGICGNSTLFRSDSVELESAIKNYKNIFLLSGRRSRISASVAPPTLITGISDPIQIYATHSLFPVKSLLSIKLKIVNLTPFKIDHITIKILYPTGVDIFPQQSNPKSVLIDELPPLQTQEVLFCLNVLAVGQIQILFDIIFDPAEPLLIRTIPYKIGVLNFILPNYISSVSRQMFANAWTDIENTYST